jgi:hypothetical protein
LPPWDAGQNCSGAAAYEGMKTPTLNTRNLQDRDDKMPLDPNDRENLALEFTGMNRGTFSWRHGANFVFHDDDSNLTIEYWASNWTGKETVAFNGKVVSSHRSFRLSSAHTVTYDGAFYRIEAKYKIKKAEYIVTIHKNDVELFSGKYSVKNKMKNNPYRMPFLLAVIIAEIALIYELAF